MLLMILVWFASCETEDAATVDQSRIHTSYELFYNAAENKTYAYSQFRFGNVVGTVLSLSGQSEARFDNNRMNYEPITGRYEHIMDGFVREGTFSWQDNNGKKYTNSVAITETEVITNPAVEAISKAADFEYIWGGKALEANQSVGLFVSEPSGENNQFVLQVLQGASSVSIGRTLLDKIKTPTAIMIADRSRSSIPAEAPTVGGLIIAKYRTPPLTVKVNP
jgi:hypothetical protein